MNLQLSADIDSLMSTFRSGLLEDVVPFWLRHAVDHELGGIFSGIDRTGRVIDTDKAIWPQARFVWLLGELGNDRLCRDDPNRADWLRVGKSCLEFIDQFGFDANDGRMWFHVTRSGRPIRKRRYAFSESFAAIAFGEFAKATGSDYFQQRALDCFHEFVAHHRESDHVFPKFTGTRPCKSIGFPMIGIVTAQQLRDSVGLETADQMIDEFIAEIRDDFCKVDIQCVMETVATSGEVIDHFDGRTLNPGHAIEGAWFIMREGMHRGDDSLVALGSQMLDWMWARGWDDQYGGLLYFVDVFGHAVQEYWHDMKFWWPHNEAVIATLLAFHLTRDKKYADWFQQVWTWTRQHFPDTQHGEWFGYLHRDGTVSSTLKGNLWKGPFHIPRMQLECWRILESMKVAAESHSPS